MGAGGVVGVVEVDGDRAVVVGLDVDSGALGRVRATTERWRSNLQEWILTELRVIEPAAGRTVQQSGHCRNSYSGKEISM